MSEFKLTKIQKFAVEYPESMVVTACPGSGKTTIMKEKIRLITPVLKSHQGVLAISFTVKASEELQSRCKESAFDTKRSFFGTIDGFCLSEIILPFLGGVWGGSPRDCSILKKLNDETKNRFGLEEGIPSLDSLFVDNSILSLYKSGYLYMGSFSLLALFVLEESYAARRYLKSRYTRVFLDEYQDVSHTQHQLFLKLVDLGLVGVAVGDKDQSIFGFRGSDSKYLNDLVDNRDDFKPFSIDINHRSDQSIINYASRVLNPNCKIPEVGDDDINVGRVTVNGSLVDAGKIASEWIKMWLENREIDSLSDVVILAKKEKSLKLLADGMTVDFRLFIDTPLAHIGSTESGLFIDLLRFKCESITTSQDLINEWFGDLQRTQYLELRAIFSELKTCTDELVLCKTFRTLARFLDFQETEAEEAALLEIYRTPKLLQLFYPTHDREVQLMTLHKSKGLEFKVVLHFDMEEWSFPYRKYTGSFDDPPSYPSLQQELNLHYVGITRAEKLCLLVRTTLRLNAKGNFSRSEPSCFWKLPQLRGLYKQATI